MATLLPWEIIIDILCRLPVKDLLRYRSVAKPLRSLIDGPDFIKLHLTRSLETTSTSNLGAVLRARGELHWLRLGERDPPRRLSHPIDNGGGVEVLGSCNGLIALANSAGDMALWNPSTRRCLELPISEVNDLPLSFGVFMFGSTGFGHDPVSDDYKLLRVMKYCDAEFIEFRDPNNAVVTDVRVYSLKAKAWKTLSGFPSSCTFDRNHGVFAESALHWIVSHQKEGRFLCWIVAFDLVTEEFRELSLPDFGARGFYLKLVELRGCLCAARNFNPDEFSESVEVWMMDYGAQESWTKLFSVDPSSVVGKFSHAVPIVYLKGTDQVVVEIAGERFILYDLGRNTAENVGISGLPEYFQAHFCVSSLVKVGDGDGDDTAKAKQSQAEEDESKRKKQRGSGKKRDDFLSTGFKLVL